MRREARIGWRTASALLLGLDLLLGLLAARADSSVADEHPHILSGWLYWASGRFAGGLDNPPLGQLVLAARSGCSAPTTSFPRTRTFSSPACPCWR